jgi:uncharacterized protein (TIGR03067 family)
LKAKRSLVKMNDELERLQGRWKVVTLEVEGQVVPDGFFAEAKVVVKGDNFSTIGMGAAYAGKITVDVASSPRRFDVLFNEGPHKGQASLGIYELNGSAWKICLGFAGRERPKDFTTTAGSGHALEILERETSAAVA